MRNKWLALAGLASAAMIVAGCGSSSTSSGTSAGTTPSSTATHSSAPMAASHELKTAKIGGVTVLTNAKGFTLYWFGPDTSTTSKCSGSCATFWPPVPGPATAGPGVTGKLGTIKRSDGSVQATYDGHPLYTYAGDKAPGQNSGNNINASGGVWHEVTASAKAKAKAKAKASAPAPAPAPSSSSGGGGYGY